MVSSPLNELHERALVGHFEGGRLLVSSVVPATCTSPLGARLHQMLSVGSLDAEQFRMSGGWTAEQLSSMQGCFDTPTPTEGGSSCGYFAVVAPVSAVWMLEPIVLTTCRVAHTNRIPLRLNAGPPCCRRLERRRPPAFDGQALRKVRWRRGCVFSERRAWRGDRPILQLRQCSPRRSSASSLPAVSCVAGDKHRRRRCPTARCSRACPSNGGWAAA